MYKFNSIFSLLLLFSIVALQACAPTPDDGSTDSPSDSSSPVIFLQGDNPVTLIVGDSYNDAGYSALDDIDGDLTNSVLVVGTVDTLNAGNYEISYSVSDSSGNETTISRTVQVSSALTGQDSNGGIESISILSGNNQTSVVGLELLDSLEVKVLNSDGVPLSGQLLNFSVVSGGGSVFAGSALSDSDGIIRERWTLGTVAGEQMVEVRVIDSNGDPVVLGSFTATALPMEPAFFGIASGNNQQGTQLRELSSPVTALVEDQYGNPVPDVTVSFSANDGGTVAPSMATTNSQGQAMTLWTLGPEDNPGVLPGNPMDSQTLNAAMQGFDSLTFAATVMAPSVGEIIKISGDNQSIETYTVNANLAPIVFEVRDEFDDPITNVSVLFSTINPSNTWCTEWAWVDDFGRVSFECASLYRNTTGQVNFTALVEGTSISTSFLVNVVPRASNLFSGIYSCSVGKFIFPSPNLGYEMYDGDIPMYGDLNELDGSFSNGSASMMGDFGSFIGQFEIDVNGVASGAGTYIYSTGASGDTGTTYSWSCTRG
jgi:hypothetical protein